MALQFYDSKEVSSGMYEATITDVQELEKKWQLNLQPSQEDIIFDELFHWSDKKCSKNSTTYQLFSILGNRKETITIKEFRSKYLGKKVDIVVSDNMGKDGKLYHNITQFFDLEDWDDIEEEYDSEELEEDGDEELEENDEDEELPIRNMSSNGLPSFKRSNRNGR